MNCLKQKKSFNLLLQYVKPGCRLLVLIAGFAGHLPVLVPVQHDGVLFGCRVGVLGVDEVRQGERLADEVDHGEAVVVGMNLWEIVLHDVVPKKV